uniref:Receptor ligand binding region domain-containing protein n=1 Tax=Panagrolaimus sp. JU765 TaxID=591449 RepID=A0AC34RKK3_9BILA
MSTDWNSQRTSPPFSSEAVVILKLLNKLKYRQVVVITVFGDVNGLEFTTVFEENRIDHDVHVQKYIELHLNGSLSAVIAKEFEEVTSNSIILCAKRENAENIFEAAKIFTGTGKMWIVNQASAQAKNFPNGFLTVKVKQNVLSALTDALIVIKNGVKFLEDQERAFLPPEQCSSTSVSNAWTNEVGFKFY